MVAHHFASKGFLTLRYISFFLFSTVLVACTTTNTDQQEYVVHMVLVWLNEPGNEEHINQIIDETKNLKEIVEIKQLRVGKSISSNRNIVDDSFDVGIYMAFESVDEMQRYLLHPRHKDIVKTVIKPLSNKLLVYDFNGQ